MEVKADDIKAGFHFCKALCLLLESLAQDALAAMLVGQVDCQHILRSKAYNCLLLAGVSRFASLLPTLQIHKGDIIVIDGRQ